MHRIDAARKRSENRRRFARLICRIIAGGDGICPAADRPALPGPALSVRSAGRLGVPRRRRRDRCARRADPARHRAACEARRRHDRQPSERQPWQYRRAGNRPLRPAPRPGSVQAQITGSIIGTTLLFLGLSALVGGVGRTRQIFNQSHAGLLSTLLFLVVVAISLPAPYSTSPNASPHVTRTSRSPMSG